MFRAYRDLDVWQKAMRLVTQVYAVTEDFPRQEQFGLISQIRRSAVSVPSNIAEGKCRTSQKEFLRHLDIAYASLAELETQLEIAMSLKFISENKLDNLIEATSEIAQMPNGLRVAIESKAAARSPLPASLEIY